MEYHEVCGDNQEFDILVASHSKDTLYNEVYNFLRKECDGDFPDNLSKEEFDDWLWENLNGSWDEQEIIFDCYIECVGQYYLSIEEVNVI